MSQPRVLHVVHRFPFPPDKGDRIRAFHTLRHLAGRSKVWLAAFADEPVSPAQIDAVSGLVERLAIIPNRSMFRMLVGAGRSLFGGRSLSEELFSSKRLRKTISNWCQETTFDAAIFSASSLGPYAELPELDGVRKLVDFVDLDSLKWKQYAETTRGPKAIIYRREYERVERLERELLRKVQAITFVSEDEADLFRSECRDLESAIDALERVHAVTNGVDLDFFASQESPQNHTICFLGAMDYRPNVEAVVWFTREVFPHLRKKYADFSFLIVGRNPVRQVKELEAQDGIQVTGKVDDVRPWVARSAAVVAPLMIARGVQNKVLEAMAMGRVVVASRHALTGLQAVPDQDLLVATTPDDWFYQIRRLFEEPQLRNELALAGRKYVEAHHS